MDSNDCIRCLDKLVQWHDASEKNVKLEKDVKKLKKKIRRIQKRLQAANELLDAQDAIITLLLNR